MSTGTTVQITSMVVLWVVRDGTGLLRALNFTATITSSASTNSVIAAISHSRKSWNQMMSSITGVAPFCMPSCQGSGWPASRPSAAPPARTVTLVTTNAINRLNTSIVECAPSTRKTAAIRPLFAAHRRQDVRLGPAEHGSLPRAWQLRRCGGTGGNPGLSNHNSGPAAMHLIGGLHATNGLSGDPVPAPYLRHGASALDGRAGRMPAGRLA